MRTLIIKILLLVYCKVATKYKINNDLTFSIDSINDYRCPRDLECFWSGDVHLIHKGGKFLLLIKPIIWILKPQYFHYHY